MDIANTLAAGGEPVWSATFTHPDYGDLRFVVESTPKVRDWLSHGQAMAAIAPGLTGSPDRSALLAAAVAGIGTIIKTPVVHEERKEDPDVEGHVTIRQTFYDPLEDEDGGALVLEVWLTFMKWRQDKLMAATEAVKNSSGAMSSLGSDDASPAATTSPQPILA